MKPRLLDLFCCQGGAGRGYADAGFEVVGVDIDPQPRYPFEFHQGDAMTWPLDGFDAVHASPPCQDHSSLASRSGDHGTGWMLAATIERLTAWGGPWVVENVERAEMPGSLTLCGSEFGLRSGDRILKRHRKFLSNVLLMGAGGCTCSGQAIGGVYGNGGAGQMTRGFRFDHKRAAQALGIDWMSVKGQAQSIPPAYTQFIGEQLLASHHDYAQWKAVHV
jgi:DNA (cytosine-5)-methyltransferase 1